MTQLDTSESILSLTDPGHWRLQGDVEWHDERLKLSAKAGAPPLAYALSKQFYRDFRLECRSRYTGSLNSYCGYGIWFRVTSPYGLIHPWGFGYAYQYDIGTKSLKLCKYPNSVDCIPSYIWPVDTKWHDLVIEAQGIDLKCLVDGEQVLHALDWTFWYGAIGFGVWNGATAEIERLSLQIDS